MKLSVNFELFGRYPQEKAFSLLEEAGFQAVDYTFPYARQALTPEAHARILGEGWRDYALQFRERLEKSGLVCSQAHAPMLWDGSIPTDLAHPEYRDVVYSIRSAAVMGAKTIVLHTVEPRVGETVEQTNLRYFESLIPYAREAGIQIAIENLWTPPFDLVRSRYVGRYHRPEDMNRLISRLASPWVCVCLDVGHAAMTGVAPEEYILGLTPGILGALHIHDNGLERDDHTLPYLGKLHWEKITQALKTTGYSGDFTLELTGKLTAMPEPLVPYALRLAGEMGKYLMGQIQK